MLKYRIITAVILLPIFIALLFFLSPFAFMGFTGLVVLWAAWEWSYLMGVQKFLYSLIYPGIILIFLLGMTRLPFEYTTYLLSATFVWWLIALTLVVLYPRTSQIWGKNIFILGLMGIFTFVPCWFSVNFIRLTLNGIYTLLFLFILIWGADIGAYFVGRAWGKHKLAPVVSPGKTWEGLLGSLIVTLIITMGAILLTKPETLPWFAILALTFTTVLFSVLGDLFESMIKRNIGVKDSGHLLPGHGGVLDRIDSLTSAAPIFTLGAIILGKFFQ